MRRSFVFTVFGLLCLAVIMPVLAQGQLANYLPLVIKSGSSAPPATATATLPAETPPATPTATLAPTVTATATAIPTQSEPEATEDRSGCDPSYPTVCIPPPPPDLDCGDIPHRDFLVLPPDPHNFDGNHDGRGCESP